MLVFPAAPVSAADLLCNAKSVVAWNKLVITLAREQDSLLTLRGVRTLSMIHLAAHRALDDIRSGSEETHCSVALAAFNQSVFELAWSQYPDHESQLRSEFEQWMGLVSNVDARRVGMEVGKAAAKALLAERKGDSWDASPGYQWHPMAPGVYAEFSAHSGTPEGFVFGAGWAKAQPFVLPRPEYFRVDPPPLIDSDAYTHAFVEVRDLGAAGSAKRTADQTHLAFWWKDFVENSHNRLARQLVVSNNVDAVRANRLFALLNMAIFDAYVSAFDNKFHYNHWRPYTAIRWADHDGNPATQSVPDWTNTHNHTYAFPSYPSAHGTACAAAMTVMADTFGDNQRFSMSTPTVDIAGPKSGVLAMDPPERAFDRFSQAAQECAMSRIYLGIHFRYDSESGNALGHKIGDYVVRSDVLD